MVLLLLLLYLLLIEMIEVIEKNYNMTKSVILLSKN